MEESNSAYSIILDKLALIGPPIPPPLTWSYPDGIGATRRCARRPNVFSVLQFYSLSINSYQLVLTTHCNTLQNTATHWNTLQHTTLSINSYQLVLTTHCNTLQHAAKSCNTLQHTTLSINSYQLVLTTHCNTLQHTAKHCDTLQTLLSQSTPTN